MNPILVATIVKLKRKSESCATLVTLEFTAAPTGEPCQITIPLYMCPLPINGKWEVGSDVHLSKVEAK
jgi:hypothetical protein